MKKVLSTGALLLLTSAVFAQKHEFYQFPKGKLVPPSKIDSVMTATKEYLDKNGMEQLTPTMDVIRTYTSGDTLFKVVRFGAKAMGLDTKREALLGKKPEFSFLDMEGQVVSTEQLKGKPYVLNLWFTSCPPCIAEIPGLNKMKAAFPGIQFIGMTYNTKKEVAQFLATRPFEWIQITDAKAFVDQWEMGYPTTLFIDREGAIKDVHVGSSLSGLDEEKFKSSLQKIL